MNIKQAAYKNRGSFKAQVVSVSSEGGYSVQTSGGAVYKGVFSDRMWRANDWVTVVKTDQGYSIIGFAASGPTDYVSPGSGS